MTAILTTLMMRLLVLAPSLDDAGSRKVASIYQTVVETYVSLRYQSLTTDRIRSVAVQNSTAVRKWLQDNEATLLGFAGTEADELEEALRGWITICNDVSETSSQPAKDRFLNSSRAKERLSLAYVGLQSIYRRHQTEGTNKKLSAATYYLLNGPLIVSTVEDYDFEARLLVPDLGLNQQAVISNWVVTPSIAAKQALKLEEWKAKGSDLATMPNFNLEYVAEIGPGDQVIGLRSIGAADWIRVKDWRDVARSSEKIGLVQSGKHPKKLDVLIRSRSSGERVFSLLVW